MSNREGTVEVPKFAVGAHVDVKKLLTDIGTDCAFAGLAAFSKAFPVDGGKLAHAEQSLSFAADEFRSEAVVYTGAGGVVGGVGVGAMGVYQAPPPFHMVVNRPFFATIVDERTRTMVLVSSIVEP
jgi:serine protease inhibitor